MTEEVTRFSPRWFTGPGDAHQFSILNFELSTRGNGWGYYSVLPAVRLGWVAGIQNAELELGGPRVGGPRVAIAMPSWSLAVRHFCH